MKDLMGFMQVVHTVPVLVMKEILIQIVIEALLVDLRIVYIKTSKKVDKAINTVALTEW